MRIVKDLDVSGSGTCRDVMGNTKLKDNVIIYEVLWQEMLN